MREFIYFSAKARTSGNFGDDLMKAGRMDIACNVVISALFLSHKLREDVHLHLVFHGPPNVPMHLEFIANERMPISKKDIAGLIKRMLYKCRDEKKEIFPGCFIEKKSLSGVLKELESNGKRIIILDTRGEALRKANLENCVFLIGDHDGLPEKELKRYKEKVSIGKKTYFASHVFVIIHNELDLREEGFS